MSEEKSELERFFEFLGDSNVRNELIEEDCEYNIWLLLKRFYEEAEEDE